MIGKYDNNPLIELYNSLLQNINNFLYNNIDDYEVIDPVAKAILANNGCGFSDEPYTKTEFIVNNSYGLYSASFIDQFLYFLLAILIFL